jgi:uracil-DNA glycosylase family 4
VPSLNPACTKCPLHATTSGTVCVAGEGKKDAEVMVVGEAPGAEEEKTGRPFMGASGQKLRAALAANGLKSVFITNTVRCRPPDNRKPTAPEIKACREYLDYEIKRIQPKIVVALGATPTKVLFKGKAKVSQHHGTIIDDPTKPYQGYVSYHPAAMLYDPGIEPAFNADIARLSRTLRGELPQTDVKWSIVRRGNIETFIREFQEAKSFSFDLETSGLFQHDGKGWINCVGLGLKNRTWVIPLMPPGLYPSRKNPKKLKWHYGSPWGRGTAFRKLMRLIIRIANQTEKRGISQNGKFDNLWLKRYVGKKFRNSFDTMLASHTLDENEDHDLKSLARKYLDVPEYDLTTAEKRGHCAPLKLYQYNARDCGYTLRLASYQRRELKAEPELSRLFFNLVMPAVRAMEDIELVGKSLNMEKLEDMALTLKGREIGLLADLRELIGKEINWDSPKQVATLLYEDLGIECTSFTKKGAKSTSETAIIDLKGKHVVVDKLVEYREVTKFKRTYIDGWRERIVDGKLYISYKVHGTVTGRYSSAIHSIPRDGSIRNLVEAPEGWRFVQADISQAELRIIAMISRDLEMRKCFLEGIDIHWRTLMFAIAAGYIKGDYAERVQDTAKALVLGTKRDPDIPIFEACEILLDYGHEKAIEVWDGWKEGRKRAKAINFGYVYGMYEKKFIETAKTKYGWEPTWDEAHACREGYFQLYNELPNWHEKQKKLVKLNGYVRNMFGRRRRLPAIESKDKMKRMEAERQSINAPVQGTIGDWKAAVLVEVHETISHDIFRLCGEHHDALLGLVKIGHEDEALPRLIEIIRKPRLLKIFGIELDIPMDGEVEIGPWGQKGNEKYIIPSERKAA